MHYAVFVIPLLVIGLLPLAFAQTDFEETTVTGFMTLPEERVEEFTFEKFQDGYIWELDEDGFLYKEYNFGFIPITPITGVTSFEAINEDKIPSTIPEIGAFQFYNNIDNGDGTFTVTTHHPYFETEQGEFVPYRLVENDSMVQVEFYDGKYVFDKVEGAVTTFNSDGEIVIDSDSYVVRQAQLFTDEWNILEVNNSPVTTTIVEEINDVEFWSSVTVTFTRENAEGVFDTEYKIINGGLKTTAYFTNNLYENSKFAFTQTLQLPDSMISINELEQIDLNDFVGQTFPREVLEQNEDLILDIKELNYNSGLGFEYLWSVGIFENNTIALDYANVGETLTDIGETTELDPTQSWNTQGTIRGRPHAPAGKITHPSISATSVTSVTYTAYGVVNNGSNVVAIAAGYYSNQELLMHTVQANGNNAPGSSWYSNVGGSCMTWTNPASCFGGNFAGNGGSGNFICNTGVNAVSNYWAGVYGNPGGSCTFNPSSGSSSETFFKNNLSNGYTWLGLGGTHQQSGSNFQVVSNGGLRVSYTYTVPTPPDAVTPSVSTSNGQNTVTWSQPNNNGATIDQYDIYGNGVLLHSITNSPTTTSWVHTNPVGGTPIYYQVYSHNSAGWQINAPNSNTVTPVNVPSAPAVPTGTFVSNTSNTVTWTAPSSDGGSAVTGYQVFRNGVSITTVGNVLTYTDTGVTNPSSNSYSVSAINAIGTGDQSGGSVIVFNGVAPTTPTNLSAIFNDPNGDLSWTASDNGSPYIISSAAKTFVTPITVPATWSLWQGGASPTTPTMGVTGVIGNAFDFNGVSDQVGSNFVTSDFASNSQGSISIWIKPEATGSSVGNPFGGTGFQSYWITNTPLWSQYPSNSFNMGSLYSNANAFTMNQWNHVVVTIDSSTANNITTVYVDGSPVQMYTYPSGTGGGTASNQNSKTVSNLLANTMLGGQYHPSPQFKYPFDGKIDEVSSWNKVLSQSEVTTLYNAGNGNTPDSINSNNNLITYFPLDDTSSTLLNMATTSDPVTTTYSVERDNSQITTTTSTTYSDTPSLGSSYDYTVSSSTTYGTSSDSNTATIDLTYPNAPTGLSTAYNDPNVDLSWTAPSSSGGSAITGYIIEHSTDNNTWTTLTTTSNTSVTYTHTSPVIGSLNYYKVSGVNTYGTGAVSNTSSVLAGVPPDAPSITASYNNPANSNIEVAITNGASMGTGTFTQWNIERSADGSTNWTSAGTATTSPFTDTGVPSVGDWYYRATTQSNHGTSAYSTNALASPVAPDVPTNLTSTISNPNPSPLTISLDWDSPINFGSGTLTGYEVYRDGSLVTTTGTASQYDDTVTVQGTYVYTVKTLTTHAVSGLSGSTTISTPTQPSADSSVSLSIDNPNPNPLDITVSFTAPSSDGGSAVTGYNLSSSPDDITYTQIATGVTADQTVTVSNAGTWYFKSLSTNNVGSSTLGSAVSIATPTVPGIPSLTLSIADPNALPFDITSSFVAPTSDGGSAVTGYNLYYSSDNITYSSIASAVTADQLKIVSGIGTHYFKAEAINNIGTSALSSAFSIATPVLPTAVSDLAVSSVTDTTVGLTWSEPANGGSNIIDYTVYRDGNSIGTTTTVGYADSGLTTQTSYVYTVYSRSNAGTSLVSNSVTQVTQGVPAVVSNFQTTTASLEAITLSWTAPNDFGAAITGYLIERESPTGNGFTPVTTTGVVTAYSDTGLTPVTQYNYRISAINSYGSSPTTTSSTTTLPAPPTGVVATPSTSTSELVVTWTAPADTTGMTGYQIYRENGIGNGFTLINTTTTLGTTFTDTGLTTNVFYNYKLKSITPQGNSAYSNTYAQTTYHIPDAVTILTATAGDFIDADLAWTQPTNLYAALDGYRIYTVDTTTGVITTLISDTNSNTPSYTVTNLDPTITYNFRVSPLTIHGDNNTGTTASVTATSENVLGNINMPTTVNPEQVPIIFEQSTSGNNTLVKMKFEPTLDVNCDVDYKFAQTTTTYSSLAETTELDGKASHTMTFNNSDNDIVEMLCYDSTDSTIKGQHLVTKTTIPFKEQSDSFKNGDYGIVGKFGSIDLITLFVVLISMVGFNRYNPIVGVGIMSAVIAALAWIGIIEPITLVAGILTMVFVVAVVLSRRKS